MNRKFAINSTKETETGKAVAAATPITHAFAKLIMDMSVEPPKNTNEFQNDVQRLFDTWPGDEVTQRLAGLVEILSGYKPKVNGGASKFKIGTLFKVNSVVYATFYVGIDNITVCGICSDGKHKGVTTTTVDLSSTSPSHVTLAEAGLFCKDLLKTAGADLLVTVAAYGNTALANFLKEVGTGVV